MNKRKTPNLAQYLACAWAAYRQGIGLEYAVRNGVEVDEFFEDLAAILIESHDSALATAQAQARKNILKKMGRAR